MKKHHPVTAILAPEQQQLMKACTEALKRSNVDTESEAFGQLVAAKHSKLSAEQRMYAESLISNILYKGITNKLSDQTTVIDNTPTPVSSYQPSPTVLSPSILSRHSTETIISEQEEISHGDELTSASDYYTNFTLL